MNTPRDPSPTVGSGRDIVILDSAALVLHHELGLV